MELQNWEVNTESFKNFTEYRGIDHCLTFFFFLGVNILGVMLNSRVSLHKHGMLTPASQKKKL